MAYATATASPIRLNLAGSQWTCEPCEGEQRLRWTVEARPDQDICLEAGEFQVTCRERGIRRIGRLTGRTRKIGGWDFQAGRMARIDFPTVELFEVETVVEMVGELPVLVGRRGERLEGGTWYVSRNALA